MKYRFFILAGLLTSCQQTVSTDTASYITYRPHAELYNLSAEDPQTRLWTAFKSITPPVPITKAIVGDTWFYNEGQQAETLIATAVMEPGQVIVTVPHRVQKPNRALWYTQHLNFTEEGVLAVSADDGAQVFINGKQVPQLEDRYFPINTTGKMEVTIRVLNNAMAGGLRHVDFIAEHDFDTFVMRRNRYERLRHLVKKIVLLPHVTPQQLEQTVLLCGHFTDDQKLQEAEKELEDFPLLTGPWLTRLSDSHFNVSVLADDKQAVTIRYGTDSSSFQQKIIQHGHALSFQLDSLKPNQTYYYQLESGKTRTPVHHFSTTVSDTFSFNVWADSQSGWDTFQQHVGAIGHHHDAFGIAAGDLVGHGADEEQWREFFGILSASSASIPYYLVAGNHDYDGYYDSLHAANYHRFIQTPTPYFSWSYGSCAFIALDPNEKFPIGFSTAQKEWFHQAIKSSAWQHATWRFVVIHQPPYSQGWEGYAGDDVVRQLLDPIMETAAVDFVIAGHTHDYERLHKQYGKQSSTLLIVGGAGGSLEPEGMSPYPQMDTVIKTYHTGRFFVNGKDIRFEARDIHENLIDAFEVSRK